jgi:flavorubredoxin
MGRQTASASNLATLADGKLYALQNALHLDGRVSAYPARARGYAMSNCYLLVEDDAATLLDTGYAAHEPAIRRQIASLIGPGQPLSLFPLRLNEFMSINNVETLAAHLDVEQCYTGNPDAAWWFDFGATSDHGRSVLDKLKITVVGRDEALSIGGSGGRVLDVLEAPVRLISTRWIYDRATKTLFTSDMFTHVWRDTPEGPWFVDESNDISSFDHVRSFLLNTRYWWLEGVNTGPLRDAVAKVADTYDIETLAPGYGAIIRGRDLVEKQFRIFDDVLASLDRDVQPSRYVDRDEER